MRTFLNTARTQVETFLLLDAGTVAVVEPHQHFMDVEIDAQTGLLARRPES